MKIAAEWFALLAWGLGGTIAIGFFCVWQIERAATLAPVF